MRRERVLEKGLEMIESSRKLLNQSHYEPFVISVVSNLTQRDGGGDGKAVFVDDEVEPQVLQVIRSATRYITFVTPYVDLWVHLKDAISEAKNRRAEVKFFIREGENRQRPEDLKWLRDNVKVYEIPYLHAKIYLNEKVVLVNSMNITEVSTRNSKEFAMLVRHPG